jgi:hypothetical protein
MQLQRNRPINPQKHLDFVKRDDAFFSSLAAAKTKKARIAHRMYFYFMQPATLRAAAHLPLRKRRHFVARAPDAAAVRDSLTKTSARGAPTVGRYRCAMAGVRC